MQQRDAHGDDPSLLSWMRDTAPIARRVTLTSFAFTVVVAVLLVVIQQELSGSSAGTGRLLGLPFSVQPITGGDQSLLLLVFALGAWVLLSSLSALVVSRQVRNHLRTSDTGRPDVSTMADSDEDAGQGGSVIAERLLLQVYLNLMSNGARALTVTAVLAFTLPRAAVPGLLLGWIVVVVIGRHRYRVGASHQQVLRSAAEQWQADGSPSSHLGLVDAIYLRERFQRRLTLPQALAVVAVVIGGVLVPAWLSGLSTGGVSLVLTLMWLQGLIQVTTDLAPLGWRWTHRLDLRARPVKTARSVARVGAATDGEPSGRTVPSSVQLSLEPPDEWPAHGVVWVWAERRDRTLVVALGPSGSVAGIPVDRLAAIAWQHGLAVVALQDPTADLGYPGLGTDAESTARALWRLVDPQTAVVLTAGAGRAAALSAAAGQPLRRRVVIGGAAVPGTVWLPDGSALRQPDRVDEFIAAWFDPTVGDAGVEQLMSGRSRAAAEGVAPAAPAG